jgi:hypothetical protein
MQFVRQFQRVALQALPPKSFQNSFQKVSGRAGLLRSSGLIPRIHNYYVSHIRVVL